MSTTKRRRRATMARSLRSSLARSLSRDFLARWRKGKPRQPSRQHDTDIEPLHVVTGASSGVGRALARLLAERGHSVLAIARRAEELDELRLTNPERIRVLTADLSDPDERTRVAGWISDGAEGGGGKRFEVASLTHSAAVVARGYLKDVTLESYRELMAINVEAPLFLTQALLPHFREGARVLHLSSGAAHRCMPHNGMYSISKAALLMTYRAWNADFADGRQILVGSAMPGVVDGPMQDAARLGDHPCVETYRSYKERGMLIKPERVAEFLCWLLFEATDEEFMSQDWNIFDDSHHLNWLRGALNC